jgi:enterobactin synthetase component D / holo-[acyl-carrier protein] synthase
MTPFARVLGLDLPHGRCVGVALPDDHHAGAIPAEVLAALPEGERRYAEQVGPARRVSWVGGRIALRAAFADLACDPGPILATTRGAPRLPPDLRGSISHKHSLAVGIAARTGEPDARTWHLGIDLERIVAGHSGIARYVLRPEERERLPSGDGGRRNEELLFIFSAKEAIYKALDPFLARYVSFREVSVERRADGSVAVTLFLRDGPDEAAAPGAAAPFDVDLRWLRRDDFIITTARVSPLR